MPAEPLGILLLAGDHERAHYAFVLATSAAALERRVILFATNAGCHALCADWSGLADAARDEVIRGRGVAGLAELREAARALGVRLMACEAGLAAAMIAPADLLPEVEIAGATSFLGEIGGGQMLAL